MLLTKCCNSHSIRCDISAAFRVITVKLRQLVVCTNCRPTIIFCISWLRHNLFNITSVMWDCLRSYKCGDKAKNIGHRYHIGIVRCDNTLLHFWFAARLCHPPIPPMLALSFTQTSISGSVTTSAAGSEAEQQCPTHSVFVPSARRKKGATLPP